MKGILLFLRSPGQYLFTRKTWIFMDGKRLSECLKSHNTVSCARSMWDDLDGKSTSTAFLLQSCSWKVMSSVIHFALLVCDNVVLAHLPWSFVARLWSRACEIANNKQEWIKRFLLLSSSVKIQSLLKTNSSNFWHTVQSILTLDVIDSWSWELCLAVVTE